MTKVTVSGGVSSTIKGHVRAASQAEVTAGTVTNKYVSPSTLQGRIVDEDDMSSDSDELLPTQQSVKAYVDATNVIGAISITTTTILDDTAFGKIHVCSGTSSDYNVTLPTPASANYGKSIIIKGAEIALLTKVITLIGEIDGETDTRKLSTDGCFILVSTSNGYQVIQEQGSWIPFVPVQTGYSVNPIIGDCRYFREGRKVRFFYYESADGTSNATTKTLTIPFAAKNSFTYALCMATNSGTTLTTPSLAQTRAASTIIDLYKDTAFVAWTASGNCRIRRLILEYEI